MQRRSHPLNLRGTTQNRRQVAEWRGVARALGRFLANEVMWSSPWRCSPSPPRP